MNSQAETIRTFVWISSKNSASGFDVSLLASFKVREKEEEKNSPSKQQSYSVQRLPSAVLGAITLSPGMMRGGGGVDF